MGRSLAGDMSGRPMAVINLVRDENLVVLSGFSIIAALEGTRQMKTRL
jgi:hypothetical protein